MILGMGVPELAVILVVVLVVFGPKNLPKLGSSLGKTVKNFRDGMGEGDEALAKAQVAKADAEATIDDPDDEDAYARRPSHGLATRAARQKPIPSSLEPPDNLLPSGGSPCAGKPFSPGLWAAGPQRPYNSCMA